jgi:uncharacterized protein with von Willebrand factor type A (vWA) domain
LEIANFASIVTDMEKVRWGFISAWLMPHSQSIVFAEMFERGFAVMGRP